MKICILTKYYPPHSTEGIPRTRELYAKGFARLGHEVHVVTSGHDGYTFERDGVFVHEIPHIRADEIKPHFAGFSAGEHTNFQLSYSYRVYRKMQSLLKHHAFDLIDSPLWDLEGYITKLKIPSVPMVVRLETTSRHIREINHGDAGELTIGDCYERNFLALADGFVFDSWAIYEDVKRLYRFDFSEKPWRVIHHGIEPGNAEHPAFVEGIEHEHILPDPRPIAGPGPLRVLYVGRLEKRKGADFLIQKVIPEVLRSNSNIEFHLVGRDCSEVDGFSLEHGTDYGGWAKMHLMEYWGKKLFFHGYLSDEEVRGQYAAADVIVNFSRYESFGLLYLEAMRMKKMQLVFRNEAIGEILHGCDGPIQVPIDDRAVAVQSILDLEENRESIVHRGQASHLHFLRYFTDEVMVRNCDQFFRVLIGQIRPRIIHVMYALDQYDGVSNIALDYFHLTQELGYESILTGRFTHSEYESFHTPIEDCLIRDQDIVLIHYWGFCDFVPRYHEMPGKKVLIFHNITNPYFFDPSQPEWQGTAGAYAQMRDLSFMKRVATFSRFSQIPLYSYFGNSLSYHVLPPLIDRSSREKRPCNESVLQELMSRPCSKILFVGRVVAHKKQEDLVRLLSRLDQYGVPGVELYLVGNSEPKYESQVRGMIDQAGLVDRVFLTGRVSDLDLVAYYRGCDVFVSMSEHEGFCLPLIDAMVHQLPVVGFAQPAVAETIGDTEAVFSDKSSRQVLELLNSLLNDSEHRHRWVQRQNERLKDFNRDSVAKALFDLIESAGNE